MRVVLKHVPLERWIQPMTGGFKTVNLAWVNKAPMIGYTWLFVYENIRKYEGRMNAAPVRCVTSLVYTLIILWTDDVFSRSSYDRTLVNMTCDTQVSCPFYS